MKRLAIITTHPIQYNAPWFSLIAARKKVTIMVFYTWGQLDAEKKYDPGFGKNVQWDIPLLEGYSFTFVNNTSATPGTHHFKGIVNPSLNKEIKAWKPDAILVFGWNFKSHLKCLRHFHKKIPVLFRGDSTLLDETSGIKKNLRRLFLKWVYGYIDYALFVGVNNKKYFLAHGVKEAQLIYAPHAIDNDRFTGAGNVYQYEADIMKKDAGICSGDTVLLFAGKLEAKKNPLFLTRLLKTIKSERLKVLYVGSGELIGQLQSAAAADNRIMLMDFQNQRQMPVIYRMADIFILPSAGPGETWGLALNEAMACGKAVVASDKAGGAIDLVENGVNGLITDLKNNDDLLKLLQQSFAGKDILEQMGKRSLIKVKDFTFDHIVNAIEDVVINHL